VLCPGFFTVWEKSDPFLSDDSFQFTIVIIPILPFYGDGAEVRRTFRYIILARIDRLWILVWFWFAGPIGQVCIQLGLYSVQFKRSLNAGLIIRLGIASISPASQCSLSSEEPGFRRNH